MLIEHVLNPGHCDAFLVKGISPFMEVFSLMDNRNTYFRQDNPFYDSSCWRRLHNKELNDLYSSPNIVQVIKLRRIRWAGHVACMGEERGVYRVLVGKPEGKRPLGRPTHRWVDNIRIDLQEVGCGYMDWIGLAQDRDRWRTLVSAVMNLQVP